MGNPATNTNSGVQLPGYKPGAATPQPQITNSDLAKSRTVWPIKKRKSPNATVFLDPGYYAGYPNNAGVPTQPELKGFWHTGIDMNGPGAGDDDRGNTVHAIRDGVIEWVGEGSGKSWGNLVILRFVNRMGVTKYARYAHVQWAGKAGVIRPTVGQQVKAGAIICHIGKGYNNKWLAHLHFDILHTKPPRWDWWPARYAAQSTVTAYAEDPQNFLVANGAVEP